MIKLIQNYFIKTLLLLILSCSSIPQNTSNSCKIFDERYLWYIHSKKVEQMERQFIFNWQLLKWNQTLTGLKTSKT